MSRQGKASTRYSPPELHLSVCARLISHPKLRSFSVLSSHRRTATEFPSRHCVKMSSMVRLWAASCDRLLLQQCVGSETLSLQTNKQTNKTVDFKWDMIPFWRKGCPYLKEGLAWCVLTVKQAFLWGQCPFNEMTACAFKRISQHFEVIMLLCWILGAQCCGDTPLNPRLNS